MPIEPTGSSPSLRHRLEEELHVLLRVAERLLPMEQRRGSFGRGAAHGVSGVGQLLELELRGLQPLLVGMLRGELLLDLRRPR